MTEKEIPTLSNALSAIQIIDFQGIKNMSINNLPLNARWIFLTGENGFGKTSILRAIAKGLVGDENFVLPQPITSKIYLDAVINQKPYKSYGNLSVYPRVFNVGFKMPVATYGVSRFQLSADDQEISDRSKQITYSLFHDNGLLINIEQELTTAFAYNKPRFKKLKEILTAIIPNIKDIKIDMSNGKPKVRYCEIDEHGKAYAEVALNELAAGYRSILTMVGDMVIRLSEANNNKISNLSGIVLIDEIDAHLHPKYQYELPNLLSKVFPKVQFIVTTHSPIPILSLPENNKPVILTVKRNAEDGITVDRKDDDFDIRQLNPEALLTSPIFDFQTLFARDAKDENIIPSSDFQEIQQLKDLKELLNRLRQQDKKSTTHA